MEQLLKDGKSGTREMQDIKQILYLNTFARKSLIYGALELNTWNDAAISARVFLSSLEAEEMGIPALLQSKYIKNK